MLLLPLAEVLDHPPAEGLASSTRRHSSYRASLVNNWLTAQIPVSHFRTGSLLVLSLWLMDLGRMIFVAGPYKSLVSNNISPN